MTNAEFSKSFAFNLIRKKQYYSSDVTKGKGCHMHYIARMVRGTAEIRTEKKSIQIKEGDVFYIPKGLRYRSFWYPDNKEVCFYSLGFDVFPMNEAVSYCLQKFECDSQEMKILSEIENELDVTPNSVGNLYCFLGKVLKKFRYSSISKEEILINKIVNFMQQNDNYTIQELAWHCTISESGLYDKIKKHFGKTPAQLRQSIICDKAKILLSTTDMPIESISNTLCISSPSYFYRIFKEQTGKTPKEYRKLKTNI